MRKLYGVRTEKYSQSSQRDDYSVHGTWIRGKGKWFNWHSQNTSSCTEREGLSQSLKKKKTHEEPLDAKSLQNID